MSYNTKNHMKQGGDEWVINGALTFGEGAVVEGLDGATVAKAATAAALGGIKAATKGAGDTVEAKIDAATSKLYVPTYPTVPKADLVADATDAEDVITQLNALLAALQTAGLMADE